MGKHDDNDSENSDTQLPFSQRPEWAGFVPVQQDDGPNPVCPIAYTPAFSDAMDYFRGVLKVKEKSPRALQLCREVILLNAANYTAWHYRRLVLAELLPREEDRSMRVQFVEREMDFVRDVARLNPKNYQLWHHRRLVSQWIEKDDAVRDAELLFTQEQLLLDAKNYHAWAYRQLVLTTFGGAWDAELAYVDTLLHEDVRNNSAWNERFFVLSRAGTPLPADVRNREIEYTWQYIRKAPNNPSPWAFMKGLVRGEKFEVCPRIQELCETACEQWPACLPAHSLLLDIHEQQSSFETAVQLCEKLCELDSIRKRFWRYRSGLLQQREALATHSK